MENISNQVLGYIALFIGVVVGWALCWLWMSIKNKKKTKSIIDQYKKGKRIWRKNMEI